MEIITVRYIYSDYFDQNTAPSVYVAISQTMKHTSTGNQMDTCCPSTLPPLSPLPLGDSVLGCGELPCLGVMHGGTPELRRRHKGIQREKEGRREIVRACPL